MPPLNDITVIDFSTLLPGPMATGILADAGAKIIKVERPDSGDEMRSYPPFVDEKSINFAMLNKGKHSISADLKDEAQRTQIKELIARSDVLIEQFRPGVMQRLGLDYEQVKKINPQIIYCSINGWGSHASKTQMPGHDLNFMAETGILSLTTDSTGKPSLPPILAADIAGGAYPAVINILLALRQREQTGTGCQVEIAMAENLYPFLYWALGNAFALQKWPEPNNDLVTGGSPRYQIYRTKDNRYLAAAPLEQKFWNNFTRLIGLPDEYADDQKNPALTIEKVADIIKSKTSSQWMEIFAGQDTCCSLILTLQEALADPHWAERNVFAQKQKIKDVQVAAYPSVVAPGLRQNSPELTAPELGEHNAKHGLA